MKKYITLEFISNAFIVAFIAILPYFSQIKAMTGGASSDMQKAIYISAIIHILIAIAVFKMSVFGLSMALVDNKEQGDIKSKISKSYWLLVFSIALLPYLFSMIVSFTGINFIAQNLRLLIGLLLLCTSTFLFFQYNKYSRKSIILTIPLIVWIVYRYFIV